MYKLKCNVKHFQNVLYRNYPLLIYLNSFLFSTKNFGKKKTIDSVDQRSLEVMLRKNVFMNVKDKLSNVLVDTTTFNKASFGLISGSC
jgi:hypothetical protein